MILQPNKKNIDFSDLKSVIKGNGYAIVGLENLLDKIEQKTQSIKH